MKIASFCVAAVLLLASTVVAFQEDDLEDIFHGNVLPFHPITMNQYRTLLDISGGRSMISEARLIGSGMTAIKGIALGIKQGVLSGLTLTGLGDLLGEKDSKGSSTGYPLCVISTQGQGRSASEYEIDSEEDNNDDDSGEYEYQPHYPSRPRPSRPTESPDTSDGSPVVNCVVVVKRKRKTSTTVRPTKRPSRPSKGPNHIHIYPHPPSHHHYPKPPEYTSSTGSGEGGYKPSKPTKPVYGGYWPTKPVYNPNPPHKPGNGGTITDTSEEDDGYYGHGSHGPPHKPSYGGTMSPAPMNPGYGGGYGKPKRKPVKHLIRTKHRFVPQ